MTVSVNIQYINRATTAKHGAGEHNVAFDTVTVYAADGSYVCLFLPKDTGQSVADAINDALYPALDVEAAE